MAFNGIRPALSSLRGSLIFGAACAAWVALVLAGMLLGRDDVTIGKLVSGATAVILLGWPWLRRWATFAIVVGSLAMFLILAEALIRVKYFGIDAVRYPTATRYKPMDTMADPDYLQPAAEPGIVYTLRPGFRGWVKGAFISANKFGVRERDLTVKDPERRIRVMTLGTSITMGEGVPAEKTFTSVLGDLLTRQGYAADTLNFGIGGYTLGTAQGLLQSRGLQFRPDVVVQELTVAAFLGETKHSVDELWDAFQRARDAPPRASFFEKNSFAIFAIYPPVSLRARLSALRSPRQTVQPADDGFVRNTIISFGRQAVAHGFVGVIFVPRPINSFGNRALHLKEREMIRRIAATSELLYADSYDRFSPADEVEALSVFPAELHPNAAAHARYAAALFDAVAPIVKEMSGNRTAQARQQ